MNSREQHVQRECSPQLRRESVQFSARFATVHAARRRDKNAPMKTAPENSKIAQIMTACHSLRVLEPTEVAKDCRGSEGGAGLGGKLRPNIIC